MTISQDAIPPPDHLESWVGIVDDDASLRTALSRALRGNGIRVQTFASAEQFLQRGIGHEPDCIVLDLHLAGISGLELKELLVSRHADPPIIFISGHDDLLSQRARIHGTSGYLRKPFDTSALVALIRPHLRYALPD